MITRCVCVSYKNNCVSAVLILIVLSLKFDTVQCDSGEKIREILEVQYV